MTIRGLFEFNNLDPISIDEVEPWTEIVKNSKQVPCLMDPSAKKHMKTWRAMNRIGGKVILEKAEKIQNVFKRLEWRLCSAIKQKTSCLYVLVSINYLTNARFKSKWPQGANPEKVVITRKVVPWIAETQKFNTVCRVDFTTTTP
jgi:glutamate synthase (ferredoxin)